MRIPPALAGYTRGRTGEFLRFGLIGVLNTGTYYGFFLLLHLTLPYLAAHVLAFATSLTISFFLNCRFTFHVRPTWRRLVRFPLGNMTTFVVMTVGVALLVEVFEVGADLAAIAVAIPTVPISFVISRLLLLGHMRPRPADLEHVDL